MRNTKAFSTVVSILTAILMIFMVSVTVYATGELGTLVPPPDDSQGTYVEIDDPTLPDENTEPTQQETEAVTEEVEQNDDSQQSAEDNYLMYGDDLPQVESQEVVEPTTVEIPDIEITDISLMGGVIAWLCVAVGIAVVAGVLVSQRTKQVQKPRDKRRR